MNAILWHKGVWESRAILNIPSAKGVQYSRDDFRLSRVVPAFKARQMYLGTLGYLLGEL